MSTTTGPLSPEQRLWLGVLHGGPTAMIGGLSATEHHRLKGWHRDEITVLVANEMSFEPLDGYRFIRTRRSFKLLVAPGEPPVCRLEPAVLIFASLEPVLRTALGAVTATVQQRLTTTERLRDWIDLLAPLRRAHHIRDLLVATARAGCATRTASGDCPMAGRSCSRSSARSTTTSSRPWRTAGGTGS